MPVEILVPPLSQTSDSLFLLEWLKKPGEKVIKGEALFTVETDKASLEVESPETGTLFEVYAKPQTDIAVRSVIGLILKEGEPIPQKLDQVASQPPVEKKESVEQVSKKQNESLGAQPAGRLFTSPRARKLARENNLDLSQAVPTGMRGMVIERDAQLLARNNQPISRKEPTPPNHIRQVIAKRMLESHLGTAPVSYMRDSDATQLVKMRNQAVAGLSENSTRLTFTDFMIYITCRALEQHPEINSTFENGKSTLYKTINLALAVDTDRGLIVPVLRDAEKLSVRKIADQRKALVESAIKGSVSPENLAGGTFTLTNLGALGIDFFTPIINPPQVGILGIGRIRELPAIKDGGLFIRSLIGLSLTCDHRVIDGAPAARFLETLCQLIENPDDSWL